MYIIRADGNAKIGAGHLMRCMTIAGELAEIDGGRDGILFLCADVQSAALAAEHGFRAEALESDYRKMESELPLLEKGFGRCNPKSSHIILVDSYYVTDAYLEGLRAFGRVALLDDLGERRYPVDCVINYNACADGKRYKRLYEGSGTCLALGCGYVPVRAQFLNRKYRVRGEVKRVLITTGGGDIDNIAGQILEKIEDGEREYTLVTGQFNPHFKELKELERRRSNIHILHNVADMGSLMEKCDLAVTAGGSTIYELAAVGVPFICFSYAKNQEALTKYIGEKNIAGYSGAFHIDREGMLERLETLFEKLAGDFEQRRLFHEKEQGMVDGGGAYRLARLLTELSEEGKETKENE